MKTDTRSALRQLSALSHDKRLDIFRYLVKAGPDGAAAGVIADSLAMLPNSLTAQLNILTDSGLITRERDGRSVIYRAAYEGISRLIVFLMEDCCAGQNAVCEPVLQAASRACCPPSAASTPI